MVYELINLNNLENSLDSHIVRGFILYIETENRLSESMKKMLTAQGKPH